MWSRLVRTPESGRCAPPHAIVRLSLMASFLFFAFSWWAILLRIIAIVHFIRRRPNFFWIWVILAHWVGALIYIAVELIPDV